MEEDYDVIAKKRPILSKEGTQTVRYEIADPFLNFWFRYFDKYQTLVEIGNYKGLSEVIKADYTTYSGISLEGYFRRRMRESFDFRDIGSWWQTKGDACEIDIVGIYMDNKKALVAEVKRQRKNFRPNLFQKKVEFIRSKILDRYEIESRCFSMEDM